MYTKIETATMTAQERGAEATRRLKEILGLTDLKLLATALSEVSADEAERNSGFANRVKETYRQLEQAKVKKVASPRNSSVLPKLIPIAAPGEVDIDPHGDLDPFALMRLYGIHQLRAALTGYSVSRLKEASTAVEQRNPGTKPTNKSRKDSIIDYIVEHVAGPGY